MVVNTLRILIWFSAGAYGIYVYYRHRRYVGSLPDSPRNRSVKWVVRLLLAGSVIFLMTAFWNVANF